MNTFNKFIFFLSWISVTNSVCYAQKKDSPIQEAVSKVDTAANELKQRTGLDISGLDPTASVVLPGGKSAATSLKQLLGTDDMDLGLKIQEFKEHKKEKKAKKEKYKLAKVEYKGIPMQQMTIKYGSGDKANIEVFHVLKTFEPISEYVRLSETQWYDLKTKKLSRSVIQDPKRALPLHGSYKKYVRGNLVEEGYYYKGARDGRWVRYDAKYNLLDKTVWSQGFPAESRITYYDSAYTRIKEIVPVQFGMIDGEYLAFYKEGQLMEQGKYERGKRVGKWSEYYQFKRQRRKEVQYPESCWDEDFDPFVLREWDDKGKLVFDYTKDAAINNVVKEKGK
jgi:antitoxin component YwqK of YwqJK toxin-antitoxin module